MLVDAAKQAGMKVPEDPDKFQEVKDEYPHFCVFCLIQLGKPMSYMGEHWENAKVIAEISDEKIKQITFAELQDLGLCA
jgi:hypothetical protein